MNDQATPQEVFAYIDQLHADIQSLLTEIERQMKERSFVSLPKARDQIFWSTSDDYDRSSHWRVRRANRFFVREEDLERATEHSVFYGVVLEPHIEFEFIPFLVGRVIHPPLAESKIYTTDEVWNSGELDALTGSTPKWRDFSEEKGWCAAIPDYKSSIKVLRGYILDLFDLDSPETVERNIIEPLCSEALPDLDKLLSIEPHRFPAMAERDGKKT